MAPVYSRLFLMGKGPEDYASLTVLLQPSSTGSQRSLIIPLLKDCMRDNGHRNRMTIKSCGR